jgi:glycosyltransferase involved in cell wall biosynthesis
MKIFILATIDGPAWACDNICEDWKSLLPETVCTLENCDIIWLLSNWQWQSIPSEYLKNKKVICTVHHIVEEKLDRTSFMARDEFVDAYHSPCQITKNALSKYTDKHIEVLPYWYVESNWKKQEDKSLLKNQYKLPTDKLLIGSFQRDTEGSDLKSPKPEKGPDLFCDIIEKLNPKPHIVLTGWRRDYIINRLKKKNISYSYFELANHEAINDLYNCLDYYLITSRVEGGPQALLESLACGTNVLSTRVGMCPEILADSQICSTIEDFITKINKSSKETELLNNYENYEFSNLSKLYIDFFKKLHEGFPFL